MQLSSDDELEIQSQGEGSEPNRSDNEPVNLDEDVEDFVVADDDTLGGPLGLEDIPLEFTRHAHKKPIQYFRDAVEWMVHNKLNPAFPRNDPVYTIARQKLDDVVQALAGSKYSSAIWKPEFSKAMRKYPNVTRIDLPKHDGDCEACGRSGHPAKHQLIFNGKPYHRGSLEEISSDEESDEVEGSGDEDQEQPAEPQSKAFFVGRTCRANAETFHAFNHWRHQLNHFVLELLEVQGHMDPNKIVERANWSVKKRERYANQVVDALEADGRVRDLYREFKENIAAAREADVSSDHHESNLNLAAVVANVNNIEWRLFLWPLGR